MSKQRYSFSGLASEFRCYKFIYFLFFLFLLSIYPLHTFSYANEISSDNYQLDYKKDLISISASKADLKSILIEIAEQAEIFIQYPASLDKKITIRLKEVSLKKALQRLLKGFNYSIIYTGSKKPPLISEVYILKNNKAVPRTNINTTRITNRIKSYERRIESIQKSLSGVDENSARGKRYLSQLKSYEKNIENLKRRLD